ncbi:MAG: DNA replication/repair protein RecF [Pseudomonadota bacterium]
MSVSQLTLSHFRSHHVVRLDCDARPLAIFGANGAGKTNILEAVSMLSPGRGLRRASAEDMTRRPEALGWKIKAEITSQGRMHEIETWSENGGSRQVKIDDKTATQVALGQIARVVWLIPSMDRLWIEGAEGRRRFLDRMTLSFEPTHAEHVLAYEKAMRERNRLLKDMVRDPHWYRVLEQNMAAAGAQIRKNRQDTLIEIAAAQSQAETAFPAADLTLTNNEVDDLPTDADALAEMIADCRPRDIQAGRSLIGPHRDDVLGVYSAKGVPAKDSSTGEQKALLISLILANGRALKERVGEPPLLLLDEVAAHLDGDRRAALYDEICALGAQAWMTGTGPELFLELGDRAQHLEVSEADSKSRVTFTI